MSELEVYLLFGGIFGFFSVIGIVLLILGPKGIATSSFEEASQEVAKGPYRWVMSLVVVVLGSIIVWFLFGHKVPLGAFLFVLLGVDLMMMLIVLLEYQTYHLSRKRVEELEQLQNHEGGEEPSPEKG